MERYTYAWGYRSREKAEDALCAMMAEDDVSRAERPILESYRSGSGATRWKITLAA